MAQIYEKNPLIYLCMSYNKYIFKRKKLSNAVTITNDPALREKLVNFIRIHPDHELRRQTMARDASRNILDITLHNEKINDLIDAAKKVSEERVAYKKIWDSEAEIRKTKYEARKAAEKQASILYKAEKIETLKEKNFAHVTKQKENRDAIRSQRIKKQN